MAEGYFRRSYLWGPLFLKRRKFDHIATTGQETLTGMVPVANFIFLVVSLFFYPFFWLALATFLIYLYLIRRFLRFVYSEKGFWFAAKSALTCYILYLVIYAGAGWYLISLPFRMIKKRLSKSK